MDHPTRRAFLTFAGAAQGGWPASSPRPNILIAIADDWSWPWASITGSKTCRTPAFDRVAGEGVLFRNAFVNSPSCTPSRGSILTGQAFWRLEEGANIVGTLKPKFEVYPDVLEKSGYHIGFTGKGWGPGSWSIGGRTRNPAGPEYNRQRTKAPARGIFHSDYSANFREFLNGREKKQPFCFWFGAREPHRGYEKGSGRRAGKRLEDVTVPSYLPDSEEVRSDLLDYALEAEWADRHLGNMLQILEEASQLENTLVVVTSDNGMPFPRCKANLYDTGTQVPLAIRWGERVKSGRIVEDFASLPDLGPTFLEAAGLAPRVGMTARSLLSVLTSRTSGLVDPQRDRVFLGRERHTEAQPKSRDGYPMRAVRTKEFLYIRNFKPERYPAGTDQGAPHGPFSDIDESPTLDYLVAHRDDPHVGRFFDLATAKRPAEELYHLRSDPGQLSNVAASAHYKRDKERLSALLMAELRATGDPRALGAGDLFDNYIPSPGKIDGNW